MSSAPKQNTIFRHVVIVLSILLMAGVGMLWERGSQSSRSSSVPVRGGAGPHDTELRAAGPASISKPRLVVLTLPKYPPSEALEPVLKGLQGKHADQLTVEIVNVWQDQEATATYGAEQIPTLIFFAASGEELARHTGSMTEEEILVKWREVGVRIGGIGKQQNEAPGEKAVSGEDWR